MTDVESLLPIISEWFREKEKWLRIFAEHDVRVEGWFKGEMLMCFQKLRNKGLIEDFEAEYTIGERGWAKKGQLKIDFRIKMDGRDHLCELKAACISESKTGRSLDFYFRSKEGRGLVGDFRKLGGLSRQELMWILSWFYPAPAGEEWARVLRKYQRGITPWVCLTQPESYPDSFFIACWRRAPAPGAGPGTPP